MTAERPFWSPYRKGAAIALIAWASSLGFVVALIGMLLGEIGLHWWLFALMAVAVVVGPIFHPSRGGRRDPARCPVCAKSVFLLTGGESLRWDMELWWPERECSECGADLTDGRLWR